MEALDAAPLVTLANLVRRTYASLNCQPLTHRLTAAHNSTHVRALAMVGIALHASVGSLILQRPTLLERHEPVHMLCYPEAQCSALTLALPRLSDDAADTTPFS
jgi:hypothetical protein